jgi:hypothetical protein
MQSNMTLAVGFKGKAKLNGVAMYDNNGGLRSVGGIIDVDNTVVAKFGLAVFSAVATSDQFVIGKSVAMTTPKYRGVLLANNGILANMPSRPDSYLNGTPATAVYHGALWFDDIKREDGTTAAAIGDLLSVQDTTGKVCTRTAAAGGGFTAIPGSVIDIIDGSVAIMLTGTV